MEKTFFERSMDSMNLADRTQKIVILVVGVAIMFVAPVTFMALALLGVIEFPPTPMEPPPPGPVELFRNFIAWIVGN